MATYLQLLGDTLADRMKSTAGAAITTTIELGVINSNLSLSCDSLETPIPKGDYMIATSAIGSEVADYIKRSEVNRITEEEAVQIIAEAYEEANTGTTTATEEEPEDNTKEEQAISDGGLKAGDRVLVAWCGNTPVVISSVVSS